MANPQQPELTRNPQTGRYFSKIESAVKRAQFDARAHGLNAEQSSLLKLQATVEDDTKAIQEYVLNLVQLVRETAASELSNILPQLMSLRQLALDDVALTTQERQRIARYADELVTFIRRKTAVMTRVKSVMKNVAKSSLNSTRDTLSNSLQSSDGALFRMMGRMLQRAPERQESPIFRQLKENLSTMMSSRLDAVNAYMTDDDEDDEPKPVGKSVGRARSRKVEKEPAPMREGTSASDLLQRILDVDTSIAEKLDITNQLLRTGSEYSLQEQDAKERSAATQSTSTSPVKTVKDKKTDAGGGLLGSLLSGAAGLFRQLFSLFTGGGGLLGIVGRLLMPALRGLGVAASVIGAAWLGWNVGSLIAKWAGLGDSTDALKKLLDNTAQTYTDSLKSMGRGIWENAKRLTGFGQTEVDLQKQDEIKRAWDRGLNKQHAKQEDVSYDEAVEFNRTWKPVQTPQSAPTLDSTRYPEMGELTPGGTGRTLGDNVVKTPAAPKAPVVSPKPEKRQSFDYNAYKESVAARESRGNYTAENTLGYLGKYQMGAMALEDAGLLKKGASHRGSNKAVVDNPDNWTIPGGKAAFLKDQALQERVMKAYTERNRSMLQRLGVLSKDSAAGDIAGKLAHAHLLGVGSLTGKGRTADAYGTTGASYYAMGVASQYAPPEPSPNRTAAPVVTLASAADTPNVTVIAPQVQQTTTNAQQPPIVVPMPIRTDNPDTTIRAISGVNTI